ncbi:PhoX family phosphatase [Roseateles sp. DAIF2]|uniref:PhoX family protein n=1 Tax=Roseateles sp. DAIF2 TaxID=2714952 RepID=UPI0018A2CCCB|nr:PhoX family phosphatase [Roseateles sp. DAIF2]QPF73002.1 PhoX family phosphatase [Roseateles sp. DAIF2]
MSQDIRTIDPDDIDYNNSQNETFQSVLQARLARRSLLRGAIGSAAAAVFGSVGLSACGGGDDDNDGAVVAPPKPLDKLGFAAVAKSLADAVVVPAGYTASIIYALGDPLNATTGAYKNDGSDGDFENRAGDHHDGMEYYGLSADGKPDAKGSVRGLLVMNHEATSHSGSERASAFVHVNGGTNTLPRPAAEVDREVPLHGVSVVEVKKNGALFGYVKDSAFNRRITPLTPVLLSGAAAGSGLMKTKFSADGKNARGTLNNCGTGSTPWGTTLTGEENWSGYFTRGAADDAARANDKSVASLKRYGRNQGAASRHGWETGGADDKYARWDISKKGASADGSDDYRNELNTFGYLVEIDPYSKTSAIKKRTTLGRFAHESAAFSKLVEGKPLAVYMGDDSRGEYIYKFVSAANWAAADANPADRIATGDKYLDSGKLYVAKFNADGTGTWIELSINNATIKASTLYAFADQADVVVNARLAADAVGATKMDRPEWCASHPVTGEVYFTLTNNSNRTLATVDAANPRAYDDTKGASTKQSGNVNGHIIRLAETADAAGTAFKWDVYLFGAEAGADKGLVNLSSLTEDQDMSSPDGLWFSRATGLCWIQTDDGAYTDKTNCMMLAGIPGTVGDGGKKTLAYTGGKNVDTYVGKAPTADTLKRFLVGPVDCEITGCAETPDGKALFINIQHPGETITSATVADPSKYLSHWPGNAGYGAGGPNARPRSATIVITKNDGGVIGS